GRGGVEEVDRAVEVVPGVSAEDLGHAVGPPGNPVDFDAELDREPQPLRFEHRVAVPVEVVATALDLVRNGPELASLAEVVDVLGKADLVDAALPRDLDEALHGRHAEVDRLVGCAEMHGEVEDPGRDGGAWSAAGRASTIGRSSGWVPLRKRASPGTAVTRPPAASTSDAQSVAGATSPASAARSRSATKP